MMPDVFIDAAFWTAAQCARVREAIDRAVVSPAEIYAGDYRVDERVRKALEADVDAATVRVVEEAFARLRPCVSRFFDTPLVGGEGPGFLRYLPGSFYAVHRDTLGEPDDAFPRRLAVVLFLTGGAAGVDGCSGGALRLYDPSNATAQTWLDIAPQTGSVVAFPATWLHEVRPVIDGVRDTIVDWLY